MRKRPSYVLVSREAGRWAIEFGDYLKVLVEAERKDYRDHGHKAKDLKIIKSVSDSSADVALALKRLRHP